MGEFDQSRWKAETTWEGELPGPGDIWALLTSPAMPERVRSATLQEVKGSKVLLAGAIQHAESTGAGPPSIGRKVTAPTGRLEGPMDGGTPKEIAIRLSIVRRTYDRRERPVDKPHEFWSRKVRLAKDASQLGWGRPLVPKK